MANQSFLLRFFHTFYAKIIEQKEQALFLGQKISDEDETRDAQIQVAVNDIASTFTAMLAEQHAYVLRHLGEYGVTVYRETQYIMVALADEIFLNFSWAGRTLWEENLLEQRVFRSHMAGEEFFLRLEKLMQERDPDKNDVAKIYLLALGLGFLGKYQDQPEAIVALKRRLFLWIHNRPPELLLAHFRLFPQAYGSLLEDGVIRQLPNMRVWKILFSLTIFFFLLGTFMLWHDATQEMEHVARRVISIAETKNP